MLVEPPPILAPPETLDISPFPAHPHFRREVLGDRQILGIEGMESRGRPGLLRFAFGIRAKLRPVNFSQRARICVEQGESNVQAMVWIRTAGESK